MSQPRLILASVLSCALIFGGLLIGSIRPAQPQRSPAVPLPFAETLRINLKPGQIGGSSESITVPQGKTMFVGHLSSVVTLPQGQKDTPHLVLRLSSRSLRPGSRTLWQVHLRGAEIETPAIPPLDTPGRPPMAKVVLPPVHQIVGDQPVGIYLQAGDTLVGEILHPASSSPLTGELTLVGYLE